MTTFNLLATDGVFGGGQVTALAQTSSLAIALTHPNGSGWAKGLVRARLNRDCRLFQDKDQLIPLHIVSSFEETVLELDSTGAGNLLVFQQGLLKPLDGTPKTSLGVYPAVPSSGTAYNPYYIVTLPDGTQHRLVPPTGATVGQVSGFFDDYVWTPSVFVSF